MNKLYDIAVIGGGASGMMAAISAHDTLCGGDIVIIEKNKYTGRKIGITGKGRCNLTNNCSVNELLEAVRSNPKFLYGAVNKFTPSDTISFFEEAGVPLKTERGRRVFPQSDKASDIQFAFDRMIKERGIEVKFNSAAHSIEKRDEYFDVLTPHGTISARTVIVSTGGLSYPLTGSTGDGHKMLSDMGVKITPLSPSLVPIETTEDYSHLSGLTLKNVELTVCDKNGKEVYSERGEMLFTHFGVSGPLVLSASPNMQSYSPSSYTMTINLKPALSEEELDRRLISDLSENSAKDFINSLGGLLPQRFIETAVERTGIMPHKKSANITRAERQSLLHTLREFKIGIKGFRPIEEAVITSGGVDVSEINPKTMELKKHRGIFVCGELIDIDAYTGGYNLQLAFSTGHLAGCGAAYYVSEIKDTPISD